MVLTERLNENRNSSVDYNEGFINRGWSTNVFVFMCMFLSDGGYRYVGCEVEIRS